MRRVAAACLVGSAIEFYDFMIYGTAAALVFPTVFFPHLSPALGTIASMGTFASAFVSRPIGGLAFGYFGDRLGRKKTLIATLLIMAVSTMSGGAVAKHGDHRSGSPVGPGCAAELLQGFAVGGEWAGSALLSAEYAPDGRRGRYGMFTLLGGGAAVVLSSLTFLGVNFTIGENSPAVQAVGVADSVPDQRRSDRHRFLCADADRRYAPVRRGEGPKRWSREPRSRSCCACSAERSSWPAAASWAACASSTWRTPT